MKLTFIFLLSICAMQLYAQEKILWDAAWSHDGKYIAAGGNNAELLVFETENFELIKSFAIGSAILRLAWHPGKNSIAIATAGENSSILDVETGEIISLKETGEGTRSISWNHDGALLASANYDKSIAIWKQDGTLVSHKTGLSSKSFVGIDWHPSENQIITVGDSVKIFDLNFSTLMKFKHRAEDVIPLCVKWNPSGKIFAIGDYGYDNFTSFLQIWTADGKMSKEKSTSKAEYRNLSWSLTGDRLATASDALRIWSIEGELLYEGLSEDLLWGVDFSNDGKYIITSSFNGLIKVWDQNAKPIKQLEY